MPVSVPVCIGVCVVKRARVTRPVQEDLDKNKSQLRTFIKSRLRLAKIVMKDATGQYDIYKALSVSLRHSVETVVFYALSSEQADIVIAQGFPRMVRPAHSVS